MSGAGRGGDEMRPITALFADIVGSTGLGERLGPDEVKALVGEFVTRMSRAVEEFGGVVQAYMGDGICAYFGVPAAHEDDPERAARAGLRILGIAAGYATEVEAAWGIAGFGVRVGLNSGPAAVGLVGAGSEQTVALGDTTNVAARLQSAAEPGTIVVGPETASRLSELFVLEPVGEVTVKGRRGAIAASRLVGPRPAGAPRQPTAFVGRERELAVLDASVADLRSGRGQVLLIVGEAGLGKTRMLAELRTRVGEDGAWLEGRCASYGAEAPYGPFVDVLRAWIGAEEGDAELAVRTKLRARAGALLGERASELLPYLGLLLAIRLDPDRERDLLSLSADELAERQRDAYLAWAEALAATRPLVLAIDDLHWANVTSRELAERLLSLTDRSAVLLALTTRPDTRSQGWALRVTALGDFAHRAEDLVLAPLTPEASRELVDTLAPFGLLPDAVRAEIAARAEGNPLYLEELVRALLETGVDRRRTWSLAPAATADLPPALEALLVARIDGLDPGPRRMAQVAAVVGREFPASVASEVAGGGEDDLAALLRAGVVREIRRFPELECTFRHGLLQEAALATLTPETLRELYGRVGSAMERRLGEQAEDLEQLAFYFYRSAKQSEALAYLERAADRSADAAHALELLERAGRVAARIGDDAAHARIQARIQALAS